MHHDPHVLTGCHLDDYAEAWARRLMVPCAELARRDAEPDADYRPRLLELLASKVGAR